MSQSLQKFRFKTQLFLKHNSSTILTCIAAVGVVATAVAVAKAAPKANRLLDEAKEEKGEDLTKTEVVLTAAPAYIPSITIGASTIACIFGANILNQHHQAALTSAYALLDQSYKEYRNKVKEMFGEETDVQIRDSIIKEKRPENWIAYTPDAANLPISGETRLFYESSSGRYFESTVEEVQNAEYHFNRNFVMRGCADLNEFYEFLGLKPTEEGSVLGWSAYKLMEGGCAGWVDFDHRKIILEDGLECYVIDTVFPPEVDYDEY